MRSIADASEDAWLFAGRKAGDHLSADRLRDRLKALGITSRRARHAALLALAARMPAPILAEQLGIDPARAALGPAWPALPTPTTSPCATAGSQQRTP